MKYLLAIFVVSIVLFSCNSDKEAESVINKSDYQKYLTNKDRPAFNAALKQREKWALKTKADSNGLGTLQYLSGAYSSLFSASGNIAYLDSAAQYQSKAHEVAADLYKSGTARALARTYISQHKFIEAKEILEPVMKKGTKKNITELMLFDVYMELGEYDKARTTLDSIKNNQNYDYLIRAAKWNDYKGNLDEAINLLERALVKAEASRSQPLLVWTHSNLGDFYGHAGRIQDSYNSYLKTLALEPDNAYVKKGLAWIAYSHERNPEEALRILDSAEVNHTSPDYHLLRAEIAEFQGNTSQKEKELDAYWKAVGNPSYGDMFNAYNAVLYAEEAKEYDKALRIAEKEVENRATPETYQILAYVNHLAGNNETALEIIETHVAGKTYEPDALFHAALIYKANGKLKEAKALKEDELLGTAYEMGPVTYERIKNI